MKRVAAGLAVAAATIAMTADTSDAQSSYGLVIHMTEANYLGCSVVDDASMTCESVNEVGNALVADNFAWIFMYGYDQVPGWPTAAGERDLGAVAFGVNYDETVQVVAWSLCTGGSEIPEDDFIGTWPASGTGNAMTWPGGGYDSPSVDRMAKMGFLSVGLGSLGRITIQKPPHLGTEAQFTSGPNTPQTFDVPRAAWSSAVVSASDDPDLARNACLEAVPTRDTSWGTLKSLF